MSDMEISKDKQGQSPQAALLSSFKESCRASLDVYSSSDNRLIRTVHLSRDLTCGRTY